MHRNTTAYFINRVRMEAGLRCSSFRKTRQAPKQKPVKNELAN